MKLLAAQLKAALKKLDAVDSAEVWLDTTVGFVAAQDASLQMLVIEPFLKAEAGEQTRVCVNRRQLQSVVSRGAGDVELTFELGVHAVTKRSTYDIPGNDKQMVAPKSPATSLGFPLPLVKGLLSYAATASEKKQQYLYTGTVQLAATGAKIVAAGSNNSRLAFAESTRGLDKGVLLSLPLSLVVAIQKLEGETVWLGETEQASYAATGGPDSSVTAVARKMAVKWPDFRSFVPKEYAFSAQIDAQSALAALEDVSPMVLPIDAKGGPGREAVTLVFDDGKLTLQAAGSGTAESVVEYEQMTPDPVFSDPVKKTVTINHRFLMDFFSAAAGSVVISINEPNTPVFVENGEKKLLVAPIGKRP